MGFSPNTAAATLRTAGLRLTTSRLAVLAALADGPPHASAEVIAAAVRQRVGGISAQTVYNVLRAFTGAGLIRRIEPAGSPGLYEVRAGDKHHHAVCRSCFATVDIDCTAGGGSCLEPSQCKGFLIDEAEITFWGLCASCQDRGREPPRRSGGKAATHLRSSGGSISAGAVRDLNLKGDSQ